MRLLLDTRAFLWWPADDRRLSAACRAAVAEPANEIFVSAASVWEIAIKASIGKLELPQRAALVGIVTDAGFTALSVTAAHAAGVLGLPFHHADPFDRLLIAQATVESLTIATADPEFAAYGVSVLPAA